MQIEELTNSFRTEGAFDFPQTWYEPSYLASFNEVSGNFPLALIIIAHSLQPILQPCLTLSFITLRNRFSQKFYASKDTDDYVGTHKSRRLDFAHTSFLLH